MAHDPIVCAALTLVGFIVPGIAQTVFLKSEASARFGWPLDGGRTFRGRPVLGPNKTARGFVVMVPVTTLTFFGLGALAQAGVFGEGVWSLSVAQWGGLGFAAVWGYTLGELPNSFVKRQLGVDAGEAPKHPLGRRAAFVVDQIDSIVAALLVITCLVPTGWLYWAACLGLGALAHFLFNVLLYMIGVKERAR